MESTYTLPEIRKFMEERDEEDNRVPFPIRFASFDKKRNPDTSEIIEFEFARLHSKWGSFTIQVMIMTRNELTKQLVPTGNVRSIHTALITRFNNKDVQWS
jgi:hypothetical protein